MSDIDYFEPRHEPARTIYMALTEEATHRKDRDLEEWITKERERVWSTARDCAQKLGKPAPTMEQVEREERSAQGHVDYAAKWAIGVHLLITARPAQEKGGV